MGWDYLDSKQPSGDRKSHWEGEEWNRIGVQIGGGRDDYVSLSREEWKLLNRFIARFDGKEITPKDYDGLSKGLQIIITDWLKKSKQRAF